MYSNNTLQNISGFHNLDTIGGLLWVDSNFNLMNFDGIENLQNIDVVSMTYLHKKLGICVGQMQSNDAP